MCTWRNGYVVLRYVYAQAQALGIDVGEVLLGFLWVFVRHIQAYMLYAMYLHLVVYGTCHYVARCQAEALVILLHELLAVGQSQYAAISSHGFGYQVCRMLLFGIVQGGGMELHELHVLHLALGTVHHGYAVARGYFGVCCRGIHGTCAACCHHGNLGQIGVHLVGFGVQYVCTEAFHVWSAPCHTNAHVVLGDDLHGKVVFQYRYVLVLAHGLHQASLYLKTCVVGMMQYSEFRVASLSVQVKLPVFLLVEVHTPSYQVPYSGRSSLHHLLHGSWVGDIVTGYHGVLDMLVEIVHQQVCHRCYAALGLRGV